MKSLQQSFLLLSGVILLFAGCSKDNDPVEPSGNIDMSRYASAAEAKAVIKAALDAGITEFKLTGDFSMLGIPTHVCASNQIADYPFSGSNVEVIDLTGVTNWPEVNVDGSVDANFYYTQGGVRGLPARAFDGRNDTAEGPVELYPALREVRLPAEVKALGSSSFFSCKALITVSCSGVEEVGASSLSGCTQLSTIELPNAIRIHTGAFAFSGLTSLSLPEATVLAGQSFQQCDKLTTLKLTAPGALTLEINPSMGIPPFSKNFAKACDLTLNADKHYRSGTATPKAESATTWYNPDTFGAYTWKSITFE